MMVKASLLAIALLATSGTALAQADSTQTPVAGKPTAKKKVAASRSRVSDSELQQLKQAFEAFQQKTEQQQQKTDQQLRLLREENSTLAEQLKMYQPKIEGTLAVVPNPTQPAATMEVQLPAVTRLQSEMSAVKVAVTATANATQKSERRIEDLESPDSIHFKGARLTPGGFFQVVQIYRTHNANSDFADSYGAFPLSGSADAMTSEYRLSARSSRLSLKAEASTRKLKMMGYLEFDFLGTSPSANEVFTNSFPPRLRLAFGELKFGNGWTVAGGQTSTMLQTTRHGIDSLGEWLPSQLDGNYVTGYSYARQGSLRVTKELVPHRQWLGFAIENPETVANVQCLFIPSDPGTVRSSCTNQILGGAVQGTENTSLVGSPTNGFSTATNGAALLSSPSNDIAPDLVLKYAIEPGWGHYEVKAIGRVFHDRVYPQYLNGSSLSGAQNLTTEGGGVGVGAVLPITRKVDFGLQAIAGKGIGRFGPAGGPDVTVNAHGELVPITGLQAIVGIETHPTPKFDFNFYLGDEYYGRSTYRTSTGLFGSTLPGSYVIGYGAPQFVDSACTENSTAVPALCMSSSQNRNTWTALPSMTYRIYRGSQGTMQLGATYSYTYRRTWDGVADNSNTSASPLFRPLAIENVVMTSFRYYLP